MTIPEIYTLISSYKIKLDDDNNICTVNFYKYTGIYLVVYSYEYKNRGSRCYNNRLFNNKETCYNCINILQVYKNV